MLHGRYQRPSFWRRDTQFTTPWSSDSSDPRYVESYTASIVLHDAPLRFSLYPVPVSQCHLIGRNTFMLIGENYIEFSISIWRNVPVVNTKLCRFTVVLTSLHQWTDVKDEWGHKASPCCKLKCLIVNNLWHCTNILLYIKILTIDWQIKGTQYTI